MVDIRSPSVVPLAVLDAAAQGFAHRRNPMLVKLARARGGNSASALENLAPAERAAAFQLEFHLTPALPSPVTLRRPLVPWRVARRYGVYLRLENGLEAILPRRRGQAAVVLTPNSVWSYEEVSAVEAARAAALLEAFRAVALAKPSGASEWHELRLEIAVARLLAYADGYYQRAQLAAVLRAIDGRAWSKETFSHIRAGFERIGHLGHQALCVMEASASAVWPRFSRGRGAAAMVALGAWKSLEVRLSEAARQVARTGRAAVFEEALAVAGKEFGAEVLGDPEREELADLLTWASPASKKMDRPAAFDVLRERRRLSGAQR